jgi:hypothetical protein
MAAFLVTQPDSRTIRVEVDGGSFRIPYRFFWNGHEREPESIVLGERRNAAHAAARGGHEVRAFFLFGTITDTISRDSLGVAIERTWSVKSLGSVRLTIDLEVDPPDDARVLFPGVAAEGLPPAPLSYPGERTSYPASVFLGTGRAGLLVYSASSRISSGPDAAVGIPTSIGVSRVDREEEPSSLLIQTRAPATCKPGTRVGPRPADFAEPQEAGIESLGSLELSHRVFVVFAPRGDISARGAAAVLGRLGPAAPARDSPARTTADRDRLREALSSCLSTHLCQEGGVVGLRETPGSPGLSPAAGLGAALLARRLFPSDPRMEELALRLADFALKGQHPSGMFFTRYDQGSRRWEGVRGRPGQPLLSLSEAARTADRLLALALDLAADGLPHEKYWLGGLRFVECFIDQKARLTVPGNLHEPDGRTPAEAGICGLELFAPLARVYEKTGRDRHKKPLDALARQFSASAWDASRPPESREGRGADAEAALLAVRLFVEMRRLGYHPVEPTGGTPAQQKVRAAEAALLFSSLLIPWIRVHPGAGGTGPTGLLADSFTRQRLLLAGHETAWLLLSLRAMVKEARVASLLKSLARLSMEGSRAGPLGAAWLRHTDWDEEGKPGSAGSRLGPVDSRRLVREIEFGLRIAEDFPKL